MEINNYPNYLIYKDGRVYSEYKKICLKPSPDKDGYLYVNLTHKSKKKNHTIHRLVALHYLDNPENKKTVDHINRDKTDNRIENLRWATMKEQMKNQGIRITNKSGHKCICYCKRDNKWKFAKQQGKKTISKRFNTKTDALCFKFIYLLKINHIILKKDVMDFMN